jgi:hypothetical protein
VLPVSLKVEDGRVIEEEEEEASFVNSVLYIFRATARIFAKSQSQLVVQFSFFTCSYIFSMCRPFIGHFQKVIWSDVSFYN